MWKYNHYDLTQKYSEKRETGKMRFQRGQSIVEFALVLPLFLLFTIPIVYFGCIFADYVTLGTVARSSARAAAVVQPKTETQHTPDYTAVRKEYMGQKLPFDIYEWEPSTRNEDFEIVYEPSTDTASNGNVTVTVKAKLQEKGFGKELAHIVNGLTGAQDIDELKITYTMYSEYKYNSSNKK